MSNQEADRAVALGESFVSVLDPKIFMALELLCKNILDMTGNADAARIQVNNFIQALRRQARRKYGHDTPDVKALIELLRRTNPKVVEAEQAERRANPIAILEKQQRITAEQVIAADNIVMIWSCFNKFLQMGAMSISPVSGMGGKGKKPLAPMDVITPQQLKLWKHNYRPWYDTAKHRVISMKKERVTAAAIVLHVVCDCYHPQDLDLVYKLPRGRSLQVLRQELLNYVKLPYSHDPHLKPETEEIKDD